MAIQSRAQIQETLVHAAKRTQKVRVAAEQERIAVQLQEQEARGLQPGPLQTAAPLQGQPKR